MLIFGIVKDSYDFSFSYYYLIKLSTLTLSADISLSQCISKLSPSVLAIQSKYKFFPNLVILSLISTFFLVIIKI